MDFGVFALLGRSTSPDRSDLEFFDFEVSKKVKISAKKWFLQKSYFFSWEAFGSRYFVCRIVLGCGGVWDARNIVNFIKIHSPAEANSRFKGLVPNVITPDIFFQKKCLGLLATSWPPNHPRPIGNGYTDLCRYPRVLVAFSGHLAIENDSICCSKASKTIVNICSRSWFLCKTGDNAGN